MAAIGEYIEWLVDGLGRDFWSLGLKIRNSWLSREHTLVDFQLVMCGLMQTHCNCLKMPWKAFEPEYDFLCMCLLWLDENPNHCYKVEGLGIMFFFISICYLTYKIVCWAWETWRKITGWLWQITSILCTTSVQLYNNTYLICKSLWELLTGMIIVDICSHLVHSRSVIAFN